MKRLHTVVTWTLTLLLVTSVLGGAVSNGTVSDAVASVSGSENSTATEPATAAPGAHPSNVTASQAEAALGPFLDELDVNERVRRDVVEQAERMRADGDGAARIVHASLRTLHDRGVPREELRESAWRLRVGLLLAQLDLTDAQRAAVVAEVEAKRADDADAAEVRRAAGGLLLDYGVERGEVRRAWRNVRHVELHLRLYRLHQRHERFHERGGHDGHDHPDGKPAWAHRLQHRHDLTDEQTHEIVDEVRAMQEDGADREAIVEMVHRKLHAFDAAHRHGDRFEPHDDDRSDGEETRDGGDGARGDGEETRGDGEETRGDGDDDGSEETTAEGD